MMVGDTGNPDDTSYLDRTPQRFGSGVLVAGRLVLAVVGGAILGNIVALFAATGIDASYGRGVTGGEWNVSLPNVVYAAIIGLCVGFFAGLIAKRRGWVVGAAAQLATPIFVLVLIALQGTVAANPERLYHWSLWVGLVGAMIGGQGAQGLVENEELATALKSIRWHWLWLWLPLLGFLIAISGSLRFQIAILLIEWQIIFRPAFWVIGFFGLPVVVTFLYFTFSLPVMGVAWLLTLLSNDDTTRQLTTGKRVGLVTLIVLGIPLVLSVIWLIDGWCLSFFQANGFKIY